MMRIIAGKHYNRRLETIEDKKLRPTAGRTREAIFNMLSHGSFLEDEKTVIEDALVLDLFCGTGALGIEALSRGAKHVVFVDIDKKHLDITRSNVEHVGEIAHATFIRSDSANPPSAKVPCNLVFLDPPYESGLAKQALISLEKGNWLADNAVIVVEMGKHEKLYMSEKYELVKEKVYGRAAVHLLRWHANSSIEE